MKKALKWFLTLGLLMLMTLQLSGCTLVNVNPERDNAVVIATIDGKDIPKSYYNNYLAMVQMNYDSADQQWPTGSSLKDMKENLYDTIIQQKVFALQADKDKLDVDEDEAKKTADESVKQYKEDLGEDKYENILEQNYTNAEAFEKWIQEYQLESDKAAKTSEKYQDDFEKDPSKIIDETVGKINDTDVKRGPYEYYLVGETLSYYMMNRSMMPTDEESMKETNKTIFENIEADNANIQYAKDNKIEVSDDDIKTAEDSLKSTNSQLFPEDDQLTDFIKGYYLTKEKFDEYQKHRAEGDAASDAIKDKLEKDAEVSNSDIQKYYDDHIKEYDTSEVSAMHILTEDEDAANQIYDEAKDITSKDEFQKLVDKYKDVENIEEATDLGSFDYPTMVEEFSDAAFNADKNTVVGPVKTQFGYHVIYVYDKKDGEITPMEDVKDTIEAQLKTDKGQEEFDKLQEDLKKDVTYDIPDEIQTPIEQYADQLESDYNVQKNLKSIRA